MPCHSSQFLVSSGRNYTSYFSSQLYENPNEFFDRLVDEQRLPIQLGATLTVVQQDYSARETDLFTVSDQRPSSVLVDVSLARGNASHVQVALEGFTYQPTSHRGGHEWIFNETVPIWPSLPTKLQVHASGPVCIETVDLLFRNSTDYAHVAMSIPASMFASCLDFNVCSEENRDANACGRSLAFYNSTDDCLELRTDSSLTPGIWLWTCFQHRAGD